MKSEIRADKLLGEHSGTHSQVHEFLNDANCQLYILISLAHITPQSGPDLDTLLTIRSIAKSISEEFARSQQEGVFVSLKKSVTTAIGHFSNSKLTTNIGLVAVSDLLVYYVSSGEFEVKLARERELFSLLGQTTTVSGGSGKLQPGDMLFLGSPTVAKLLTTEQLTSDPVDISDELRAQMTAQDIPGSALLISVPAHPIAQSVPDIVTAGEVPAVAPIQTEPQPSRLSLKSRLAILTRPSIVVNQPQNDFETSKKSRKTSTIGVVLLVLLIASIVWGVKQKQTKEAESVLSAQISDVTELIDNAKRAGALNKSRAKELLLEARALTDQFSEKEKEETEYKEVRTEITRNMAELAGVYEVAPQTFLDLTLQSADFEAKKLVSSEDLLRILDSSRNRVLSVQIESKRTDVIGTLPGAVSQISAYAARTFAVSSDGVYEVPGNNKVITPDWSTEESLIASFAGNMYVLSQKDNAIWRYAGTAQNGFGEKSAWIAPGVSVDVSNARSWAIDGSIWVLTSGGKLVRFTQGIPQTVAIQGVEGSLSGARELYTSEEESMVYILDVERSRVLVLDKKGVFQAEYLANEVKDAKGLVVSEKLGKIILLSGSKLLEIPLSLAN